MDVRMPDGTIVTNVPDNMSQEALLSAYSSYAPEPISENPIYGVAANITPSLATGLGSLMQLPGKAADLLTGTAPGEKAGFFRTLAGVAIPGGMKSVQEAGASLEEVGKEAKTLGLQQKEKERAEKIAKTEGQLNKFGVALSETIMDPSLSSSFVFEQIPNLLGPKGGGMLAQAATKQLFKNASKEALGAVGVSGAVATGAAMQGTDIGHETYKDIYTQLISEGQSPEAANTIALSRGRVAAIEAGGLAYALSRIPGAREVEKALFKQTRQAIPKAGVASATKSAATGAFGSGASETGEEVGGKFISNVGKQEVFPETELTGGLGETGAFALLGGATTGGVSGAINARSQANAQKRQETEAIQQAEEKRNAAIAEALKDISPDLTSPIVATTTTTTNGKESVKTTRADGSVYVDGVMVEPPRQEAQTADMFYSEQPLPQEVLDQGYKLVDQREEDGQVYYIYTKEEAPAQIQPPVEQPPLAPANPVETAPPMPIAPDGQLPLAPVNPEGTALPAPAPPAAPVVAQLPLAPVNPEGTVIAPAKPVDPNVEARLAAVEPDVESMIPDEPPPVRAAPPAPIVQAKRVAAEPTVRYGITDKGEVGVPLSEGGKPFQTRKEAEKVQKLQPQLRVLQVKTKGKVTGYVLADKTQRQLAAEKVAAKRLQAIPVGGLLGDILRKGGINPVHRLVLGFSEKANPSFGNRRLFAAKGKGIDLSDIVESQEEGKAAEDKFEGRDIDVRNSLPDRIKAEIARYNAGESEDSVVDAQERKLAEEEREFEEQENKVIQGIGEQLPSNAEFQDFYDVEVNLENPDQSMLDAGFSQQDLNVVGFTKASPELKAEVAALMAQMEALGLETADILAEIAFTPNITDLEYYTRAKSELIKAITQAAKQGSGGNVSQANVQAASEGLESPTEAGLKAKQDAADKVAADKAKADRDADAKDKAEEQRKAIAAASEKAAGEFKLGRSAEEDLSGQKDIFAIADKVGIPPEMQAPADFVLKEGRIKEVVLAAQALADGKITKAEYDKYVDDYAPIATIPNPEPPLDAAGMKRVLRSNQVSQINPEIAEGTRVGIRMDINALKRSKKISEDTGTKVSGSVVSIHEGSDLAKQGTIIGYSGVASIKNAKFAIRNEQAAFKVAQNIEAKSPQQTIEGEWVNITPEDAYARVQSLLKDPNWAQVSLDPLRHSFFYDRSNKQPVISADEILQVGRFVLAKNVKYAPREDFLYSKTAAQPSAGDRAKVLSVAQSVSADWEIIPDVVVVDNMQSAEVPQEVKDYDKTQTGGTTKTPEGFYYRGKIYLLASQLKDEADIVRVMNHEVLGHYGLRGLFGKTLNPILDQLATARRDLVQERADAYGLDMNNRNDRRQAAEEALAILAQTRPELGFVKRAVAAIRTWLREHGFKNLKLTDDQIINDYIIPARNFIERGTQSPSEQLNDIRYSIAPLTKAPTVPSTGTPRPNITGAPIAGTWSAAPETTLTPYIYKFQDKQVDLKDAQKQIQKTIGKIDDALNAYRKETLYYGRVADQTEQFLNKELKPLLQEMIDKKLTLDEVDKYLQALHAEERNKSIAKRLNGMPDGGAGITTANAKAYLAGLSPDKAKNLQDISDRVRKIISGTQDVEVAGGLELQSKIDGWNKAWPNYVPLFRDEVDYVNSGSGMGQGFSTRGSSSKRAIGSDKPVKEIIASLADQRQKAIVRSEKARVGKSLYALAIANPNPDYWLAIDPNSKVDIKQTEQMLRDSGFDPGDIAQLIQNMAQEPKTGSIKRVFNPLTKQFDEVVKYEIHAQNRYSSNVLAVRINGEDKFLFFNPSNDRAKRMAEAIKNLDAEQLGEATQTIGNITRFIAALSTQYNPIFGAWNFARDVQGAALNLSTTPLRDKKTEVTSGAFKALRGIYKEVRARRAGGQASGYYADLYRDFESVGGKTGFINQFSSLNKKGTIVERELKGLTQGKIKGAASAVGGWLSDYNDMLENAVRLSAYEQGLKMNLSKEESAEIAKNLTVNFNRKGAKTAGLGALYAFFNSSVQGTARLVETLRGPAGKKIIAGGFLLGAFQAALLAMAGFDEDEPSEFIKQKNFVIPTFDGGYVMVPMPLGFNILPNVGRIISEIAFGSKKSGTRKVGDLLEAVVSSFNPLGGGNMVQMAMPTVLDPIANVIINRDSFGRPISREDRALNPTPGYLRSRESAGVIAKGIAEFLNYVSGGTEFNKGAFSPTGDDINYVVSQYLGGVGREAMRAKEFVTSIGKDEPFEPYKVPILGKVYGDINAPASVANKFYLNIKQMAEHENEIKGRKGSAISAYIKENPEARLSKSANNLENQISKLNKTKREFIERNAPEATLRRLEDQKLRMMKQFNEQVRRLN
jgi:hypothetical protein